METLENRFSNRSSIGVSVFMCVRNHRERGERSRQREKKQLRGEKREKERDEKHANASTYTHTHTSMTVSLVLLELLHAEQHKLFAKSSKVCVCIAFKPSSLMLLVLPIFVGENAS